MQLPNKSLEFLRTCLAETGWNKDDDKAKVMKRYYVASKLVAEVLPEVPDLELPPSQSEVQADPRVAKLYSLKMEQVYKTLCADFTLDEKQFAVVQTCLKFFIGDARVPHGAPGLALVDTFKLLD